MSNCSWAPDVCFFGSSDDATSMFRSSCRQPTGRNRRHFRHATVVAGFRDAPPWLTTARGRSPKVRRDASDIHARPRHDTVAATFARPSSRTLVREIRATKRNPSSVVSVPAARLDRRPGPPTKNPT
jgi:hypothetical protein